MTETVLDLSTASRALAEYKHLEAIGDIVRLHVLRFHLQLL